MKSLLVATGWNFKEYIQASLDSINNLTVKPDYIVIVDDHSTDGTYEIIKNETRFKFELFRLRENKGAMFSRDYGIKNSTHQDFDFVMIMDLDDYIKPNAVKVITETYMNNPECWITYGNYIDNFDRVFFDESNINYTSEDFRNQDWKYVHVRTFKKDLYYNLTKEDLFIDDITIYSDANMWLCLLELAGLERIKTITEVTYHYNHNSKYSILRRYPNEKRRNNELEIIRNIKPKKKL